MPYVIKKIRNKDLYSVKNAVTGKIHSYGTTLERAQAQVRLLNSIDKDNFLNEMMYGQSSNMRRIDRFLKKTDDIFE